MRMKPENRTLSDSEQLMLRSQLLSFNEKQNLSREETLEKVQMNSAEGKELAFAHPDSGSIPDTQYGPQCTTRPEHLCVWPQRNSLLPKSTTLDICVNAINVVNQDESRINIQINFLFGGCYVYRSVRPESSQVTRQCWRMHPCWPPEGQGL